VARAADPLVGGALHKVDPGAWRITRQELLYVSLTHPGGM